MNKEQAKKLVQEVFESQFDKQKFTVFVKNLLNHFETDQFDQKGIIVKEAFRDKISRFERIGKYFDPNGKRIDILIVYLKKNSNLNARSTLRNFIGDYLNGKLGTNTIKDAALVAFVSPDKADWRFSLVKLDHYVDKNGDIQEELSSARRWSFLVGKNERSHTAQSQLLPILENDRDNPTLEQLEEAFSVEPVSKEFFEKYRDLFIRTVDELDKIVASNKVVRDEFESKSINTVDFAKKLLGQIVFLYFIQKKGWLGVPKNAKWGYGDRNFLRSLFKKSKEKGENFFNDYLESLFYDALNSSRRDSADPSYHPRFDCKIPFLNGGLFEPIGDYDWKSIHIRLPDELFSNNKKTREGDIGDGILDTFDRFNFTVNEDDPLDKEVAVDPELLGKLYEKFNAITRENFYEYKKALQSGKKNEERKFNKKYGVFYTPREIVHYMCQQSLINYLYQSVNDELRKLPRGKLKQLRLLGEEEPEQLEFSLNNEFITREELEKFIIEGDKFTEYEKVVASRGKETDRYSYKLPNSIRKYARVIDKKLADVKIVDPAVGSGAFLVGMMTEIVKARNVLTNYMEKDSKRTFYDFKLHCIENSLYGVDIDQGATEITKLRLWLSLVVDEESIETVRPLPNLDYKIMKGNSLFGLPQKYVESAPKRLQTIEKLKDKIIELSDYREKTKLREEIEKELNELFKNNPNIDFDFRVNFSEVFREKGGFDIVIANPPYVSTKGRDNREKKLLRDFYGFADDLYNHFFFKGLEILRPDGILTFISSKTYWTIQTKRNLRDLLFRNRIIEIFDTGDPFEAMVDTAVIIVQKKHDDSNYEIRFRDGKRNLNDPEEFHVRVNSYKEAPNRVIFIPTGFNLKIVEKFGRIVKELLDQWWKKIKTSKDIEKNREILDAYRKSLKPGDITLLGLITEGGQGLATGNNGKYIGVLEGTKYAERVRNTRPGKLAIAVRAYDIKELSFIKDKHDAERYLANLDEYEIRKLFDSLKEKYGRDIFGQGYLYRIVSPDEIADVDSLTEEEKLNGIVGNRTFVPYEKGDKEGNRWYAPTPYYIDWSRENVKILQKDPKARWQGYQFYFREGFCWSDIHTVLIKARLKSKGIHDVKSMSLFPLMSQYCPAKFLVSVLNSTFISQLDFNFVNNTQTFQINDARQIPIVIPTDTQLSKFEEVFNKAYTVQKMRFEGKLTKEEADKKLNEIQKEVDEMVYELYGVKIKWKQRRET